MNTTITYYVEQIEAILLNDLATQNESNLYDIANDMLATEARENFASICQAYEVVKHNLVG